MSYLLDTCVVSELSRPRPDPGVVAWMSGADVVSLHLSVITIGEVRHGTLRLPVGKRRTSLLDWSEKLRRSFSGRVLHPAKERPFEGIVPSGSSRPSAVSDNELGFTGGRSPCLLKPILRWGRIVDDIAVA